MVSASCTLCFTTADRGGTAVDRVRARHRVHSEHIQRWTSFRVHPISVGILVTVRGILEAYEATEVTGRS
jgi:hypothetical protein